MPQKNVIVLDTLTLALDWTPNTNHTGFYIARAKGWYEQEGVSVAIESPADDNYAKTPARKLADGDVDLAIAPTESVLSYQTSEHWVDMVAIASILAEDRSAIVTLANSGIDRPAQLDGATYASYAARFEDGVVKAMIRQDGGLGEPKIIYPDKLGIMNTLLENEAQATWVFMPWEGVEAQRSGLDLHVFRLADFEIPYGYSPVVIAKREQLEEHPERYRRFLKATQKGFLFAEQQPEEAARLLVEEANFADLDPEMVLASQIDISPSYRHRRFPWGYMQPEVWEEFIHWLQKEYILTDREGQPIFDIAIESLFSNAYLPDLD